jgi:hypothetical protein
VSEARSHIADIADVRILKPGNKKLFIKDGQTDDIMQQIIATDAISQKDTEQFAPYLKGKNIFETCRNVWHFVHDNVKYNIDPLGIQYIQTPAYLWKNRKTKGGDCKSFSIMTMSLLKNLDIPGANYRFVSFAADRNPTHVYVVVKTNQGNIIVDTILPKFNTEKIPYTFNKDIPMTKIYQMSGVDERQPNDNNISFNLGNDDLSEMTPEILDAYIVRDRLLAEKQAVESMRGIGALKAEKYQNAIDSMSDVIKTMKNYTSGQITGADLSDNLMYIHNDQVSGAYSIEGQLAGIGNIWDRLKIRKQLANNRTLSRTRKVQQRKFLPSKKRHAEWLNYMNKHRNHKDMVMISGWWKNLTKKVSNVVNKVKHSVAVDFANAKKTVKTDFANIKHGVQVDFANAKHSATVDFANAKHSATVDFANAAKGAKNLAQFTLKVLTAPQRAIIKLILTQKLPMIADFFLYLFINDPKLLAKVPEKVRAKRKKAEILADFICFGTQMSKAQFMGLIRNSVIKKYKKQPEAVIADMMKGKISGIGEIVTAIIAVITIVVKLIMKLVGNKKKKPAPINKDDAPAPGDWGEAAGDLIDTASEAFQKATPEQKAKAIEHNKLANEIQKQPGNQSAFDNMTNGSDQGGKKVWSSF